MLLKSLLLASAATSALAAGTFVVPHQDGIDDTPALKAVLSNYSTNSTILFKKGITYNIWTPIDFGTLTNVEVAIEGNITLPTNVTLIQSIVGDSSFPGFWFKFKGTNVTLRGTQDPQWGWVDAHGQQWWDVNNLVNRPHGFGFTVTNGVLKWMKLWKPIAWNFSLSGSVNVHAYENRIAAVSNSKGFPFNSDGFAAGGKNLLIEKNFIQNGDDCVTVGSGAQNVHFRNNYCEGGHGLSIGSLGKGGAVATVHDVLIEDIVMVNSLYGARFKSWTGGNGLAQNITWKNIAFHNVPFPIYITQNYWDQNLGPQPNTTSPNNTAIDNFNFINFAGDILDDPGYVEATCVSDPCWYYVPGATGQEVAILDLYPGTATNIHFKNIVAVTHSKKPVTVMCDPATITNDVGFKCVDGKYQPTHGS